MPFGIYLYLFLDRPAYEGRRRDLPGLPGARRLAKVITRRMFDLHLRIGTHNLDLVIALLHMRRQVGQRKLPAQRKI